MDTGLSAILFVLVASVTDVHSQITKGPVNALKKVSDSVTLDCVTSSGNCDGVEWKKMEGAQSPRIVYKDGDIFNGFKDRYSVNSTGGCSLIIVQLKISDSGKFSCATVTADASEVTRGSILVVIDVTEPCRPLTSINELTEGDNYTFSTTINVPAKSVEPSDVILSFQDRTAGEKEAMDVKQPPIVKTTLAGTMIKTNVTQHVCRASFTPATVDNFDSSTAPFLEVCTTQKLIVSYPVENIVVSPSSGPYYKDLMVRCTANGYPYPTIKWVHVKSGTVVGDGDTLVITGEDGDQYSCTATNTVKGKVTSQNVTIDVSPAPPCSSGCIAAIVICVFGVLIIILVVLFLCYKLKWCPFHAKFNSIIVKKSSDKNGERTTIPLNPPEKPPRASDTPVPNRPRSECNYAELRPETNPHQMKPNPVNNSSTVYAAVSIA